MIKILLIFMLFFVYLSANPFFKKKLDLEEKKPQEIGIGTFVNSLKPPSKVEIAPEEEDIFDIDVLFVSAIFKANMKFKALIDYKNRSGVYAKNDSLSLSGVKCKILDIKKFGVDFSCDDENYYIPLSSKRGN